MNNLRLKNLVAIVPAIVLVAYVGWDTRAVGGTLGDSSFHMILGMWKDDWGFKLSETIRVTEDSAPESFSRLPRKLFVKR